MAGPLVYQRWQFHSCSPPGIRSGDTAAKNKNRSNISPATEKITAITSNDVVAVEPNTGCDRTSAKGMITPPNAYRRRIELTWAVLETSSSEQLSDAAGSSQSQGDFLNSLASNRSLAIRTDDENTACHGKDFAIRILSGLSDPDADVRILTTSRDPGTPARIVVEKKRNSDDGSRQKSLRVKA